MILDVTYEVSTGTSAVEDYFIWVDAEGCGILFGLGGMALAVEFTDVEIDVTVPYPFQ